MPLTDPVYLLAILLATIFIAPAIANKLHIPALVVLIILGTILGSNVLNIISRDTQLILLEKAGLLSIMFLAGLQMDLSNLKHLGKRSLLFGFLTFFLPLIIGIATGKIMAYSLLTALTLGIIYSPHTLIAYPIITNLKIAQQEAVNVAVGGTIVTSILTLTGLSIAQALSQDNLNSWLWIKLLILLPIAMIIYAWLVAFISKSLLTQQNQNLTLQFVFILTCLFSAASLTLALGLDSIVGAFIAGLTLNPIIARNSQIMQQLDFVSNSIIIPMFLISVGVLCNPQILFQHPENLVISIAVIIGAVGAKFLAAWITGSIDRYSWAEIMVVFGLTMSRAALVLVIALFGKNAGLFNEGIFNAIVLYIIVTCLTGPLITNSFGKQIAISKLI